MRARRGAVDLVGQHDVGEDRAGAEDELLRLAVVEAAAGDVGRQQVGRELDAVELAGQAAGDGLAHQGLAHAGHVLQQHVLAGQQRHHGQPHGLGLAQHHPGDILLQQFDQVCGIESTCSQYRWIRVPWQVPRQAKQGRSVCGDANCRRRLQTPIRYGKATKHGKSATGVASHNEN